MRRVAAAGRGPNNEERLSGNTVLGNGGDDKDDDRDDDNDEGEAKVVVAVAATIIGHVSSVVATNASVYTRVSVASFRSCVCAALAMCAGIAQSTVTVSAACVASMRASGSRPCSNKAEGNSGEEEEDASAAAAGDVAVVLVPAVPCLSGCD